MGQKKEKQAVAYFSCDVQSETLCIDLDAIGDIIYLLFYVANKKYVFVGLNPASHDIIPHKVQPWEAFHSSDMKRAQDYKLRYALKGTEFWGSFMTDIYPDIIDTDANNAIKKATKSITNNSVDDLIKILEILGETPIVVAIGEKAFKIIQREFSSRKALYPIKKITHYSSYVNIDSYRQQVLNQLSQN